MKRLNQIKTDAVSGAFSHLEYSIFKVMTEISVRPVFRFKRAQLATAFWSVFLLFAFVFLLRVLAQPDRDGRLIWARAQRLEAANLIRPALRQYNLLADTFPNSPYALKALQREGDILTDLANAGDTRRFTDALSIYQRLVDNYPQTVIASDALLSIGEIQLDNLKNLPLARATYVKLMTDYPGQRAVVAQATNALGRVAQAARDGKSAQTWFQKTLQTFPEQPERCAEAQFRLGEIYETLWRKRDWARDAYDATIKTYPNTAWAGRARTALGLLVYGEMVPNARRVLIKTAGVFDGGAQDERDSLLNALKVVLAARGLNIDDSTLTGWSQTPFVGAFDPQNPARMATPNLNAFENAVACSGMTYSVSDGGDQNSARRNLQNEIDTAHLALVYTGTWQFVAGYDSSENLIFLQAGARVQPIRVLDFLQNWNVRSPLGGSYTLVTFSTQSDDLRADQLTLALPVDRILFTKKARISAREGVPGVLLPNPVAAQSNPIPLGTQMSQVSRGLVAPTWVFTPPTMDEKNAYRRGVRRAVAQMNRARSGQTLLNGAALQALAGELRRFSQSPNPAPRTTPAATPLDEPLARDNASTDWNNAVANGTVSNTAVSSANVVANTASGTTNGTATGSTPQSAPATSSTGSTLSPSKILGRTPAKTPLIISVVAPLERVRALLAWRSAPLSQWLDARRDAVAFLNIAGVKIGAPSLKQASQNLEQSLSNLQNARAALDNLAVLDAAGQMGQNGALSMQARALLKQAAAFIDAARQNEAQATNLMSQV